MRSSPAAGRFEPGPPILRHAKAHTNALEDPGQFRPRRALAATDCLQRRDGKGLRSLARRAIQHGLQPDNPDLYD